MANGVKKLSLGEKIGYGLGDAASNLFFQIFITYLSYFYTDVFGIPAAALGTMMLVTRIWDAVNDPIMGMIADRTQTRWGKFRPWLLWCAVPFGIFGVLMFTTPNLGLTGKLIWAYVTYTAMTMIYTAINVPYSALMGVITPDSLDRTVVSAFRFGLAFAGTFAVQFLLMRMVRLFGGGNEAAGWQWASAVFSCAAVLLFLVTFATTKERVQPPKGQKNPVGQDLKDLFTNAPWLLIGGATVFQLAFIVMRSSCIVYYFKYYVQEKDISLFGLTRTIPFDVLSSYYLMAGTVFTLAGTVLSNWFSVRLGKPRTYRLFLTLAGLSTAGVYLLGPDDLGLLVILQLIASFSVGPVSVLQWAIYTDTADYSEWKNGRRATALIMAASLFALKMGVAIGGALLAWILAAYGYVENQDQTPRALTGIRLCMSIYPSIFAFCGAGLMLFYPLSNERMRQIEHDLTERRKQYETESAI
jgi:GPH family glycoside/pentoside/hexuronide:cation symporter